jgi:predicted DNA-binding transcriptional regulator YafY
MSETSGRLLNLLSLLQTPREWPGPELARRLHVTTRTVRNDVERLRQLGYPVLATRGAVGGYRLSAGAAMPPLLLDDDEAVAIAVSLRTTTGGAVEGLEETALRALTKLQQVLPTPLGRRVDALQSHTVRVGGQRRGPQIDGRMLALLAATARDREVMRFSYSDHAGAATERRVEPYRLVNWGRRWYLVAFDLERADWRTFRVDRMFGVAARTGRFRPRPAPDAAAYVQEAVASRVYAHQARFVVHAPAPTVRAQLPASAAVVNPVDDARCEVVSGAASLDFVLMHMVLLGHAFEVVEPPELRERCRVLADRLLSAEKGVAE